MMRTVTSIDDCRKYRRQWREQGYRVAFVPTMGNLHEGHLQLVRAAADCADKVIVSIFINPTQFAPGEDYAKYPRTERVDQEKLTKIGADMLFLPNLSVIYPKSPYVTLKVTGISDDYCGRSRPGHFDGVATIVCKLFNIVQPDLAFFGEKDYQQLLVIKNMVADLNLPVTIASVPTVREGDGLAMSSRNAYLTESQRLVAPQLYQLLCRTRDEIVAGGTDFQRLSSQAMEMLRTFGFQPEYFSVCNLEDLTVATSEDRELIILTAAKMGMTRLIDNIQIVREI